MVCCQKLLCLLIRKTIPCVIPAKAGIQDFLKVTSRLDTRFRGYDDFFECIKIYIKQLCWASE